MDVGVRGSANDKIPSHKKKMILSMSEIRSRGLERKRGGDVTIATDLYVLTCKGGS